MKRLALILLLLSASLFADTASSPWEIWLNNEGYYLLSPEQKEKFRALPDEQKQSYIDNLWASLDPDPLTPENEFKKDYEERFAIVKKRYGIPSDRAKIYLLLGKPNSTQSEPNSDKYYPLEVWSYFSLGLRGLPSSLDLIFFKKWGAGDYKLYSPIFDGFKSLTPSQMDFDTPRAQAQMKALFDPSIVEAAQHITTGAGPNESEVVRAQLQAPDAMTRLIVQRKQRPNVETTIVYQGFKADVYAYSYPFEVGIFRTSVAIAVSPKYLTFEKDADAGVYRARVELTGRITDASGNEILRINEAPAVQMNFADFDRAKGYFFSYIFDSYLLPGKYSLDCLFRDIASNAAGKFEKNFEVKAPASDLDLITPLLAYKQVPATGTEGPFVYNLEQYYPKENEVFSNGQQIIVFASLLNPNKTKLSGLWSTQITLKKNDTDVFSVNDDIPVETNGNLDFARRVSLQDVLPGDYELSVRLTQGARSFVTESPLKIGTDPEVLGRIRVVGAPSSKSPEVYHSNLALQFMYRGQLDEASKHARIALDFAPTSYPARSLNTRILKAKGDTARAIAAYEKLLQESPSDSEGFFLVGKWATEIRDWKKASEMLKNAMAKGYYTTELLNDLALAEISLGNKPEAIDYWQKSLALNSNQPEVQKQLSSHQ
jgi:GWxTD domain-containing protein